ncbi:ABC transporter ATP-binding protein [Halosimplex litoreum]|uniref:ABC transporter ATP-binding protein n=1 Tax=Halosimplex litoreum TaxID=1198301 RepID=A0A7U3WTA6_9EURY|nr:ABC transporter ATP-binding protein [Halosimplex litoreum]QPV65170.1 ABC transporter ATP-binding protein [Halosimplex litoreum]
MLRTTGLTKQFGGLTAVDEVDFELGDELCSLIGPNGAGKTTFFDLLTGALEPTRGTIELRRGGSDDSGRASDAAGGASDGWVDVTDASPDETAAMGIHRSYQITNVFPTLSVLENVRIAAQAAGDDAATFWRNVGAYDEYVAEARDILDRVGLAHRADDVAENLSHGASRQLEVAVALAGDPDVLLLDEPNAGVSSESVDDIVALIEDVAADHAVLLVEHNMDIVMEVSDRVVVLNQGAVIADGEPEAVREDPAVQEAYLGGYEPGDLNRRGDGTAERDDTGGVA